MLKRDGKKGSNSHFISQYIPKQTNIPRISTHNDKWRARARACERERENENRKRDLMTAYIVYII